MRFDNRRSAAAVVAVIVIGLGSVPAARAWAVIR